MIELESGYLKMKRVVCNGITLKFKSIIPCKEDIEEIANLIEFKRRYKKQLIEKNNKNLK